MKLKQRLKNFIDFIPYLICGTICVTLITIGMAYFMPTSEELIPVAEELLKGMGH